jgi:hypothetical protein
MILTRDRESGVAMVMALVALSMFSLLGLYISLNATVETRISDNHETRTQANLAALAGINHARTLLRGLDFNDLFRGPDGQYSSSTSYLTQARAVAFRNPVSWSVARSLSLLDPSSAVSGLADDGLLSTGKNGTTNGTPLIPLLGVAQTAPNPYGSGVITTSRYFVKVSDNNGEASELAGDATDNPFIDGDWIIVLRSLGVSRTIEEFANDGVRRNSVAVYEGRYKRSRTFALDAPVVVEGAVVLPSAPNMFDGNAFRMEGGGSHYGIGTIDTNPSDGTNTRDQVIAHLEPNQYNNVRGMGLNPSVGDITGLVSSDPDKALLMDPEYLWNFIQNVMPQFADSVFQGDQSWNGGSAPYLGTYDLTKPYNHPSQDPKITFVNGDLATTGRLDGAGVLVITGRFSGGGSFHYNGIVLVIGEGEVDFDGLSGEINGGMFVVNVSDSGGGPQIGVPKLSLRGNSNFTINSAAIEMGVRILPPTQLGIREITTSLDP